MGRMDAGLIGQGLEISIVTTAKMKRKVMRCYQRLECLFRNKRILWQKYQT